MKVTQNWLKELVDINVSPEDLSEKLSIGGFEVESLVDCSKNVEGIVLGKVISIKKHNDSEKLSICNVDIGAKSNLQIICGAKNIKSDIYVYVAKVGSYIRKLNINIKKTNIRGVESEGMICSLEELGLEDKSEGIAIIEESIIEKFSIGTPVSELLNLNDFVYELAITANRPDGMSVVGIAREISALLETKYFSPIINKKLNINTIKSDKICEKVIDKNCIYTVSFIEHVNGSFQSPKWIKDRLEKSDIKSINYLVDVTNYILLEQGQPLHAFDRDKLSQLIGRDVLPSDFGVRKANKTEKLLALDGNEYSLNNNITIITCSDMPVAIAGIIGGLETSVTSSTKAICLEAAVFNPSYIRKASKEIGIRTESSSRFEKGISFKNTFYSINRFLTILSESFHNLKHLTYSSTFIEEEESTIKLRRNRINKILGPIITFDNDSDKFNQKKRYLTDKEVSDKLNLIGCKVKNSDFGWNVNVLPSRSNDLTREIDLIEEVARLIGYDRFDKSIPKALAPGKLKNIQEAKRNLRKNFIESGYNEVLTYSLVPDDIELNRIKISNPLLLETSCLRNNLWEEHIKICNQNYNSGKESCWIFEIGNIFFNDETYKQEEILNGAMYGKNKLELWDNFGKYEDINYYQARGKLREALISLKVEIYDKPTDKYRYLHPGRAAALFIEGKEVGYFGQIHPIYVKEKKSIRNIYLFSIKLSKLLEASTRKNKWIPIYQNYPTVPKIDRDINFLFNRKHLVSDIIIFIKKSGKKLLEEVKLIDIYENIDQGEENISYTFRLSYRDKEKTLKETEISNLHKEIINKIEKNYSTKLKN